MKPRLLLSLIHALRFPNEIRIKFQVTRRLYLVDIRLGLLQDFGPVILHPGMDFP
jgi:hypothetical protein